MDSLKSLKLQFSSTQIQLATDDTRWYYFLTTDINTTFR